MNHLLKRIVAGAVTAVMLLSTVPVGALAARPEPVSGLRPFTTTQDLINQVTADLVKAGQLRETADINTDIVAAVEKESEYSYDQAVTAVVKGLMENREDTRGSIDLSYLKLPAETMQELVEDTLQACGFEDSVSFRCEESEGVVTDVDFVVAEPLAQVMDEIADVPQEADEKPFPFEDVEEDRWSRPYINYLYQRDMVSGVSDTRFAPAMAMTRAMVVTILWSMQGRPQLTTNQTFPDVPAGEWYATAVRWAQENKVVTGFEDGTFRPDSPLQREQLVQIMYSYAANVDHKSTTARADLSAFADAADISGWAKEAASWAVATGVITGEEHDGSMFFLPLDVATREEYAAIACSYLKKSEPEVHVHAPAKDENGNYIANFHWAEVPKFIPMANGQYGLNPEVFFLDEKTGGPILMNNQPVPVGAYLDGTPILSVTLTFNPDGKHEPGQRDERIAPMPTEKPDYWLDWNDKNGDNKMDKNEIAEAMKNLHHRDTFLCDSVTYVCDKCGEQITEKVQVTSMLMTEEWIMKQAEPVAQQAAQQAAQQYVGQKIQEYVQTTGNQPTDAQIAQWSEEAKPVAQQAAQQAAMGYAMQLMPNRNSAIYTAVSVDNPELTANMNATAYQLMQNWGVMKKFNATYPQYLGYAAPYWTSKNKTPLEAVVYMCNAQEQPFIPNFEMNFMVSMLTQAFMSYIMQYGYMVDAMLGEAMAMVNHPELDPIDKMLLLHDWVAQYGTFDMQSMIDQTENPEVGSDPIAMTIFGTLLRSQIPQAPNSLWDGSVCLGYAATYAILLQQAFGKTSPADPVVDFVQIKYLCKVEDTSVAAGESGFGDGDAMFNSPHYFNAVKHEGKWYYVDACYDDVNIEVISQYRVETDGNVSHDNFLLSPKTLSDMYEGNYQFIDSLYDGVSYTRIKDGQGGYKMKDNHGITYETEMAARAAVDQAKEKGEVLQIFYVYEQMPARQGTETAYDDTTYEQAWFVHANSPVSYDPATLHFYYTSSMINSYSAMKDMLDKNEDSQDSESGNNLEDMIKFKDAPFAQDKLVRRGVKAPNKPEQSSGLDMTMGQTSDPHAEVLFHYGYGSIGAQAQADADRDDETKFGDMNTSAEGHEGPYYQEIVHDKALFDQYPDMTHSLVVIDGRIFFSIGHTIYTFNKSISELHKPIEELTDLKLVEVKDYNEISYVRSGKRFEGMSFIAGAKGENNTLYYRPIAAMDVHNIIKWQYDENGTPIGRTAQPTLFVNLATTLSNSNRNADGKPYVEEAVNFNPTYMRFEENKDGQKPEKEQNSNVEFMWCANIVHQMDVATMLKELAGGETADVTVAPFCEHPGFTQKRTVNYGLSMGEKVFHAEEDPKLSLHTYVLNEKEGVLICSRCHAVHAEHALGEPEFTWSKLETPNADGQELTCKAERSCTDPSCDYREPIACVVTGPDEMGVYTATVTIPGETEEEEPQVFTDEMTVARLEHTAHTYGEPEFHWNEDNTACVAVFTCTAPEDVCVDTDGKRVQEVECTVTHTGEGELQDHEAKCTFLEKEYVDHKHALKPVTEADIDWSTTVGKEAEGAKVEVTVTRHCANDSYTEPQKAEAVYAAEGNLWTVTIDGQAITHEGHKHEMQPVTEADIDWTPTVGKENADGAEIEVTLTRKCGGCDYVSTEKVKAVYNPAKNVWTVTDGELVITHKGHEHTYGDPVFVWNEDHSACTASFTCTAEKDSVCTDADGKREQKIACTVSSTTADGKVTYTAKCTFEGEEYSNEVVKEAPVEPDPTDPSDPSNPSNPTNPSDPDSGADQQ